MIKCTFEDGSEAKGGLRHVTVDTLVMDGDKILLAKRAQNIINGGKYCLIGGFVGRDETTKEAALREVKEETGYEVSIENLLRLADNPDRPQEDRENISFVYVAKVLKKVGEKDNESTEISWFDLDSLPPREQFAFDHYENIELYRKYLVDKFSIPFIGRI